MSQDSTTYSAFLSRKSQLGGATGFEPLWMPDWLYGFQQHLVGWNLRQGMSLTLADCGLGKTPMSLVWAENIVRKTNGRVLILAPLAVSAQTVREGEKFDIEVRRSATGKPAGPITVTNYEKIEKFDPDDYAGVCLDESSCIKHFQARRQGLVNEFMKKTPYRLLDTATAAPNDYIELLTSAEILGQMGRMDALGTWFKNDENSNHPIWWGARWRFRPHAETPFWRWVCSWARACRSPGDLGFKDDRFVLPPLNTRETVVKATRPLDGYLFQMPAVTLDEQRNERKITLPERCEAAAEILCSHDRPGLAWCHLNAEGDRLEELMPDAKQVKGSMPDERKEELFLAFQTGELRQLITKPSMGGFGMNWQQCADMTMFPSHSFEQYYQAIRRCWRFGQERSVAVDLVTTEGELGVLKNLQRKAAAADAMFTLLVQHMNEAQTIERDTTHIEKVEVPSWLR